MKKVINIILIMFSFFSNANSNYEQLAHEFSFNSIDGKIINLKDYKEKVIVIVNVASRCGFTNQYEDLQKLWSNYQDQNLVVIGVPTNNFKQEPGSNKEIKDFCETTFGIDFPMTEKTDVIGNNAHPFYKSLAQITGNKPGWNFHKFLISKNGEVKSFDTKVEPDSTELMEEITRLL